MTELVFNIGDYVSNNKLLNEYRNVKKRKGRVTSIQWMIKSQKPKAYRGSVVIHIVRHACQLMDWDNFYGAFKPFGDALRKNGIISDDNPSVLIRLTGEQHKVNKHDEEKVLIRIQDATRDS